MFYRIGCYFFKILTTQNVIQGSHRMFEWLKFLKSYKLDKKLIYINFIVYYYCFENETTLCMHSGICETDGQKYF